MKKRIFALALMLTVFCTSTYAANTYKKTIEVQYGIGLTINGKTPTLTDAAGNAVQPFTYNGTTYVPIRAVGEYLGATVGYDEPGNSATVTQSQNTTLMATIFDVASLSRDIHEESLLMMADFFNEAPLSDSAAKSYKTKFDSFEKTVALYLSGIEMEEKYYSAAYTDSKKALKEQYDCYLQAYAAFFNWESGKPVEGQSLSDALQKEIKAQSITQSKCSSAIREYASAS